MRRLETARTIVYLQTGWRGEWDSTLPKTLDTHEISGLWI
jgi:hypothetical protein